MNKKYFLFLSGAALFISACVTVPTPIAKPPTQKPQNTATPVVAPTATTDGGGNNGNISDIELTATAAAIGGGGAGGGTGSSSAYVNVTFTTEDGRTLVGRLYGNGDVAVILAHMAVSGHSKENWAFYAEKLAVRGYTVLTFDFRGFGESTGDRGAEYNLTRIDAITAIRFLKGRGFNKIVCIGASMGGTACLSAAVDEDISGVVAISSPDSMGSPTELTESDLAGLTIPKLFVASENDQPYVREINEMYDFAADPKQIKIFSGGAHGTNIFDTGNGEELEQLLFDFLAGI